MAQGRVFSAPNAVVYINNKKVGSITNFSFSETYNRQDVKGLGSLYAQQVPVVGAGGQWNASEFFIDFEAAKAFVNRTNPTKQQLIDTLALNEFPFSIVIFEKIAVDKDETNRIVTSVEEAGYKQVQLDNCYIDSQNWSIAENGIASMNTSGRFLSPMTVKQ